MILERESRRYVFRFANLCFDIVIYRDVQKTGINDGQTCVDVMFDRQCCFKIGIVLTRTMTLLGLAADVLQQFDELVQLRCRLRRTLEQGRHRIVDHARRVGQQFATGRR